ncbi:MAG TPA: MFS transporter [Chloroflexota bacterium]|nr:MFS transporter [Chloroflexota bacterium]
MPATTRAIDPADRLFYGWLLVVALGITTIISYGCTQYLFGVLVLPVTNEMGWDRASVSGAFSIGLVINGFAGLLIGRVVDRHGARLVMGAGSALLALSLAGLAQARTLPAFYLCWAGGLGLAQAMTQYPVTFTVVANWFQRRRGAAMALLTVLGGLSSPIFIPLAGWLTPRLGWRETLLVLAAINVVVAVPLHLLVVRRHPEDLGLLPDGLKAQAEVTQAEMFGDTLRQAARRLPFWTLTINICFGLLAANVIFTHQIAYLIGRGHAPELAASIAGALGLASLPARYVFNRLSDRIGPQGLLAVCSLLQGGGVLVLLLFAGSLAGLIVYVAVYGAAYGASSPLSASVRAAHFGRRAYGAITGAQGVLALISAGAGSVAAGALYDLLGSYTLAFLLTAGTFLLAALAMFLTPKPAPAKVSA